MLLVSSGGAQEGWSFYIVSSFICCTVSEDQLSKRTIAQDRPTDAGCRVSGHRRLPVALGARKVHCLVPRQAQTEDDCSRGLLDTCNSLSFVVALWNAMIWKPKTPKFMLLKVIFRDHLGNKTVFPPSPSPKALSRQFPTNCLGICWCSAVLKIQSS